MTRFGPATALAALVAGGRMPAAPVAPPDTGAASESVSSFGQANNGALYVVSLSDGVFRVDAV